MKNLLSLILIFLLGTIVFSIQSCNKNDEKITDPAPEIKQGLIVGNVLLPSGSNIPITTLEVGSPIDQKGVNNGQFEVYGYLNTFTTQYLFDSNSKIIMIGYSYPGAPNNDITSRSTALSLIMNTMAVYTLAPEGKQKIINKSLNDPLFNDLINEVEVTVLAGKSITDTTNAVLAQKTIALFQKVSQRVSGGISNPIELSNDGREVTFTNRRSIQSVVGVYSGNNRIKKVEVGAVQKFPSSIQGWVDVFVDGLEGPKKVKYNIPSDGNYEFKIRTGLPGHDDGSLEHDEARFNNISEFISIVLNGIIPQLETINCWPSIAANIGILIKDTPSLGTGTSPKSILNSAVQLILNTITDITKNCPNHFNRQFFAAFASQINIFEKYIGGASATLNASYFAAHWASAESALDTCLTAKGIDVGSCMPNYCLGYAEWKMLTNGTLKTWRLIRVDYNGVSAGIAPGETISYVFEGDGGYASLDGWYISNGVLRASGIPGRSSAWCVTNSSLHLDRDHGSSGYIKRLIEITSTSYVVETYPGYTCYFVAP